MLFFARCGGLAGLIRKLRTVNHIPHMHVHMRCACGEISANHFFTDVLLARRLVIAELLKAIVIARHVNSPTLACVQRGEKWRWLLLSNSVLAA